MAWRSSGYDNDDMVNNLKRFGVITTPEVEEAFRSVDRIHFVPQNRIDMAHSDQPLKEGNVHISAPHIYGTIVESLDLEPGSSHSFLNIGCGTGYLSCIVSKVLGPDSSSFGVEIFPEVVKHCKTSIDRWRNSCRLITASGNDAQFSDFDIELVCGNGLEIDCTKGECQFGFDRIYVGASVHRNHVSKLANLLRPGGVMVAPVDDDLVKVVRMPPSDVKGNSFKQQPTSTSSISSNFRAPFLSEDFSISIVSGVRFAPLLLSPSATAVIPSKIWEPSIHRNYPKVFKDSIREIMLCSQAPVIQPPKIVVKATSINLASMLPKDVWIKVLSYTHRSWFEQPYKVNELLLRQRLRQEQEATQKAKEACAEAERRMRLAERERDGYRALALRWQMRLRSVLNEVKRSNENSSTVRSTNNTDDDDQILTMDDLAQGAVSLFQNDSFFLRLGIAAPRLQHDSQENSEADDNVDEDDVVYHNDMIDEANMDVESEDDDDTRHRFDMEDTSSEEDESEDFTIAASPDSALSSFYRQVTDGMESQVFST